MPSEGIPSSTEHLGDEVRRWVDAGIISAQQGEQILHFVPSAGAAAVAKSPARKFSVVAELVSYLGIVLVLASGGLFISRLWTNLGVGGRVAVGVAVALLGFVGGRAVSQLGDEGTTRLGWFLWLCGTGGAAMATAVLTDRMAGQNSGWTMLSSGAVVLVVSVGLWRNLERPLQFLSSVAGLVLMVVGTVSAMNWHPSMTVVGLLMWTAAIALGLLSMKVVHPSLVATLVAQYGIVNGAMVMTGPSRALGMALGLLAAAAGVAYGLSSKQTPVVGLGVITFFILVIRMLSYYLRGPGTMLVAFVLGVGLVGTVIWRATRSREERGVGEGNEHRFHFHVHH